MIGNTNYTVSSGQEVKREFVFQEVQAGEGNYVWIDADTNGMQTIDEFEIAAFSDEANYIKITVFNNEFVRTNRNSLSQSLRIVPSKFWKDRKQIQTKGVKKFPFIPYEKESFSEEEMKKRSREFYSWLDQRRTVREFANTPVPREVIENIIMSASTAPSGAHKQPWTFCIISNPKIKKKIREAAEKEEWENYHGRRCRYRTVFPENPGPAGFRLGRASRTIYRRHSGTETGEHCT